MNEPTPIPEVSSDPFILSIEVQNAVEKALKSIGGRSFSERHPELGKMIKCPVCGLRHRKNEKVCVQKFTYRIGDYEIFREDENGKLVPDYRTCIVPGYKPTVKQQVGAAAFKGKRRRPRGWRPA